MAAPLLLLLGVLAGPPAGAPPARTLPPADSVPLARPNDNRAGAGRLSGGVLRVRLVARRAFWRPDAPDGPGVEVETLGEEGAPPSIPAPLLRVPLGARIEAAVRNELADTLLLCGLGTSCRKEEWVALAPGAARELAFAPRSAGVFLWAGAIRRGGKTLRLGEGTQLVGALAVDAPARPREDHLFVLTLWRRDRNPQDPKAGERIFWAMNGVMWPRTDRVALTVGDTARWVVANGTGDEHPMHLHGFFFRVDAAGDGERFTYYAPADRRRVVTENALPLGTFLMTWTPDRPGNWIFHCHKAGHIAGAQRADLAGVDPGPTPHHTDARQHALSDMAGLVVGITVKPRGVAKASPPRPPRRIRLLAELRPGFYPDTKRDTAYAYWVQATPGAPGAGSSVPGAPLVLTRGEPVEITVVNRLPAATAVHWHGIELESYYDGVAGWSGADSAVAPLILPGDSFVVRFTPPRAGTFIYHAHADDNFQLASGLYGAIVVLEPGERWDPAVDHALVLGQWGTSPVAPVAINGGAPPPPIHLRAGVPNRLRIVDMTPEDAADVEIWAGTRLVSWRPVAKDASPLPPSARAARAARVHIAPGETYDYVLTPPAGGMRLIVKSFTDWEGRIEVRR
ncbi:MAG TPA: multicopper oxidase domain-containing protein [Longimicrobiales bacterium]|nr:multicopper oxidase domain-containing protein [Longimicrobiales bacterium]